MKVLTRVIWPSLIMIIIAQVCVYLKQRWLAAEVMSLFRLQAAALSVSHADTATLEPPAENVASPASNVRTPPAIAATTASRLGRLFAVALEDPELRSDLAKQQRARLVHRYKGFFDTIPSNLTEQLKDILVEKQVAYTTGVNHARLEGLNPILNEEALRVIKEAQTVADAKLRALLGDEGYQRYEEHEQLKQIEEEILRAQASGGPEIGGALAREIAQLIWEKLPAEQRLPALGLSAEVGSGLGRELNFFIQIPDEAVNAASDFLSEDQHRALYALQAELDARATIRQVLKGQQRREKMKQ